MNAIRHIRRLPGALAGLAGVLLAFGATPALAMIRVPGPGGDPSGALPLTPAVTRTVVTGGMPGWQITLIAIGAALLAATIAVLLDRARAIRRNAVTAVS